MKPITTQQIDAILPFLGKFEEPDFEPGIWQAEPTQGPAFMFNDVVMEFYQALCDHGWVTPELDWTEWQGEAGQYVESPEAVSSANVQTIQKLLTTHVLADRFCEGHLAVMFENGHIVALMRRLREIREAM